jgi:alpha-galactosidase
LKKVAKIVIIGAGSHVFSSRLITDIIACPEIRDCTITLMDIAEEPLERAAAFARKLVEQNRFNTRIEATTDRRLALKNANYVFVAIMVGGGRLGNTDRKITLKHGLDQGDISTQGPCAIFAGLRHLPILLDICHDMEELCPDAWLLNYTDPLPPICWAMNDYTRIKNVGLCHSIQSTSAELARYIGVPYDEVSYRVAGINHMAWFLEFKWRGEDAYPLLREKFRDPEVYSGPNAAYNGPDIARAELFKAFGYYVTESSKHVSTYVPYFRKRPEDIERYKQDSGAVYLNRGKIFDTRMKERNDIFEQQMQSNYKFPLVRSDEYGSFIIKAIETGEPICIYGNVKNTGLITNLPEGCCVEVPCLVDKEGIHPCRVGGLPPQVAALNRANVSVQELTVRGIVEKDKTKITQAILVDPLTSAVLAIDEIHRMADELFESNKEYTKGWKQGGDI